MKSDGSWSRAPRHFPKQHRISPFFYDIHHKREIPWNVSWAGCYGLGKLRRGRRNAELAALAYPAAANEGAVAGDVVVGEVKRFVDAHAGNALEGYIHGLAVDYVGWWVALGAGAGDYWPSSLVFGVLVPKHDFHGHYVVVSGPDAFDPAVFGLGVFDPVASDLVAYGHAAFVPVATGRLVAEVLIRQVRNGHWL